jgi:Secretion system C-terminal sorting domain
MKIYCYFCLLLILAFAESKAQITVAFTLSSGQSSITVPQSGLTNVGYQVRLTKPANNAPGNAYVKIYAKGNTTNSPLQQIGSRYIPSTQWFQNEVLFVDSFSIFPSDLNDISGVIFAQYESEFGVNYKSANRTANLAIWDNIISPPSITSFNTSGNPNVIAGTIPKGGNNSYTFQWQSSITSATTGFSNISSATTRDYDPPVISQTTYYRRVVTSSGQTSNSNVVTITINLFPPISNNAISNSGNSTFFGTGDPSILNGSSPSGGSMSYSFQWQFSTTSTTTGFSNIASATNQNFDPGLLSQTTHYKRIVTSGGLTSESNVITITLRPIGSTFEHPIEIGNLDVCGGYADNRSPVGYGNEFGSSFEDIYYRFNLIRSAKVSIDNCKPDGTSSAFYLLDAGGNIVQGGISTASCDVGDNIDYILQPGTYYVVTETIDSWTVMANFWLYVSYNLTTSSSVTIPLGNSTTLTASGGDSYTWHPATGLSSTTGSTVIATPLVNTTYTVTASSVNGCAVSKSITITVTGAVGSTINNPIQVNNIGGCGYTSIVYMSGFGNDYGGPLDDVFYRFEVPNSSEVSFYIYLSSGNAKLTLLNSIGSFLSEELYGWLDSGDDAGTHYWGELDGTPFRVTLQPGTYFLVAEAQSNQNIGVQIDTPSGYSCRKKFGSQQTSPIIETINENEFDNKKTDFEIYPNPASDYISVHVATDDLPVVVSLINSNGVSVKKTAHTNQETLLLDVREIPSGLYTIKITQGTKSRSERIIIMR